jgi:hypothetical protein
MDTGEESRCVYCGMPVIIDIDGTAADKIEAEAAKYRSGLVSKITGISTAAFSYAVKDNQFVDNGEITIPIADGTKCFKHPIWAGKDFVQAPGQGKQRLTIEYKFGGKPQSLSCEINTPKTEDFWKIGVMLDERLRLNVYIGAEKQHSSAENLDLSLR